MSLLQNNSVHRGCSRCGKALEDMASREAGVGPTCARRNAALFARTLAVDTTKATQIFLCLSKEDFHAEIQASFSEMAEKLMNKICDLAGNNEVTGKDFREFIEWFDLALSYQMTHQTRNKVINVVEALGYPALAGVFRGEVSMSEAKLTFENGRVYMTGKANKPGYFAMRRAFAGVLKGPRYRGDKTPYSVPASHGLRFIEVAVRFWPFIEIESSEAVKKSVVQYVEQYNEFTALGNFIIAKREQEELADRFNTQAAQISFNNTNCGWTPFAVGTFFGVTLPWIAEKTQLVCNSFKNEISKNDRYYNPTNKTWFFKNNYHAKVIELLKNSGFEVQE